MDKITELDSGDSDESETDIALPGSSKAGLPHSKPSGTGVTRKPTSALRRSRSQLMSFPNSESKIKVTAAGGVAEPDGMTDSGAVVR